MAYFDSPKHRALWARELAVLREKREEMQHNSSPLQQGALNGRGESVMRVRISYEELLAEEHKPKPRTVVSRTPQPRTMERTHLMGTASP